jgi:hypothetical protein
MERRSLTAGQIIEIPAKGHYTLLALLSGEVNYRVGGTVFNDATDLKLNEDIRTDAIFIGNSELPVFVKAITPSVIQFRNE